MTCSNPTPKFSFPWGTAVSTRAGLRETPDVVSTAGLFPTDINLGDLSTALD